MKKLLFFFSLSILFSCNYRNSSNHHVAKCEDSLLTISPDLIPYVDLFISDCKHYGVNPDHIYCLDWMCIGHPYEAQGVTDFYDCSIEINKHLVKDSVGMRFVIYHELGHWFGLQHDEGIMKRSYNTQHDRKWVEDNWTQLLDEHFAKIKNIKQ